MKSSGPDVAMSIGQRYQEIAKAFDSIRDDSR